MPPDHRELGDQPSDLTPNPYQASGTESKVLPTRIRAAWWTLTGGILGTAIGSAFLIPGFVAMAGLGNWFHVSAPPLTGGLLGMLIGFTSARWLQGVNALHRAAQIHQEAEQELEARRPAAQTNRHEPGSDARPS